MSGGTSCGCAEREKPVALRDWRVTARRSNQSAFNGYHWTPSDWSAVRCRQCRAMWRTRAKYVEGLRDETQQEQENR